MLGVMFMIVVAALIAGMTALAVNMGMAYYYNQQFRLLAMNASQYAQSIGGMGNPSVATLTTNYVNGLLRLMGYPNATSVVPKAAGKSVQVTITEPGLPLLAGATMPSFSVTQTANPINNAAAYVRIEFVDGANGTVGTPMVGPNGAFLPVLQQSQLDPALANQTYMLDTDEWPATQVIYHKEYVAGQPGVPPGYVWPLYR